MTATISTQVDEVERSTLDREAIAVPLLKWLKKQFPEATDLELTSISSPSDAGMSSETLLVDVRVVQGSADHNESLVIRLAPSVKDIPIFPAYDLETQFRVLQLVHAQSEVPVPKARWLEQDANVLGSPFFVMDRVIGQVPPDVPPYVFGGWLLDASDAERRRFQETSVEAIAGLHAIDALAPAADFLEFAVEGATPLRRHMQNQRNFYQWVVSDGITHPILENTFQWLDAHWPEQEGETVISWGDSRIANMMYQDFEPVALLDWEMVGRGPRELDLGWLSFMHTFFQDLTGADMPGLPNFLKLRDISAHYEKVTAYSPKHLDWYYVYAALRHGIIMARITRRSVHFGQLEWGDDPDVGIYHRQTLQDLIDGKLKPLSR